MKYFISFLLSLCILFLFQNCFAHKLSTFAYKEGDQIIGEAYFVDGSPCINCKIEVFDKKGAKILETLTNERGEYKFGIKESGELKIRVIAGEGHLAEYKIKIEELEKEKKIQNEKNIEKNISKKENLPSLNKEEIKDMLKQAIREENEGIKNLILEVKKDMNRVKVHEILGGIGYILGILGLWAILKNKKRVN